MSARDATRSAAIGAVEAVLTADPADAPAIVAGRFGPAPILEVRGHAAQHPVLGTSLGRDAAAERLAALLALVRATEVEHRFTLVTGRTASVHHRVALRSRNGDATADVELVSLVELGDDRRVRSLRLHLDTAVLLALIAGDRGHLVDVRAATPLAPPEDTDGHDAAVAVSTFYDRLIAVGTGRADPARLMERFAPDVEIVFKGAPGGVPYVGTWGADRLPAFFDALFSTFAMGTMDFATVVAGGDAVDVRVVEPHRMTGADGATRFLEIAIVQCWRVDGDGRVRSFTSFNDAAWMLETYRGGPLHAAQQGAAVAA